MMMRKFQGALSDKRTVQPDNKSPNSITTTSRFKLSSTCCAHQVLSTRSRGNRMWPTEFLQQTHGKMAPCLEARSR